MTRDSADYRADSSTGYRTCDFSRARAVLALAGLADTPAGSCANQPAGSRTVNGAPSKLTLLSASAQKQRDDGNGRQ
jgi:hypothetical protein